jgi:hypothetical protein
MLREQGTYHPGRGDRRRRSTLANDKWLESAKTNRDMVQAVLNRSRGTEPSAVRANCSRPSAPYDTRMGIIPLGLCGHSLHCERSER